MNSKIFALSASAVLIALASCSGSDGGDGLSRNACGTLGLDSRIIDGSECSESGSPVVKISLLNENGTEALCSGSMITSDDVLTAAHCVVTSRVVGATVGAGGQQAAVTEILVHPGVRFDAQAQAIFNDVAILKLAAPLNLPTLPIIASDPVESGDTMAIFGYGRDENGNFQTLRSGETRIGSVTPQHLIAGFDGDEGSNSCNGDSGGPGVVTSNGQTGIVSIVSSGNNPSCTAGDISLYANVQGDDLLSFIVSAVPDAQIL